MVTPWEEAQILKDIMEGLGGAIYKHDFELSDLTQVKLNKLLFLAFEEFNLPITYSWFKYGVSVNSNSSVDTSNVQKKPISEFQNPSEPRVKRVGTEYPSPEEYYYFFKDDVEDIDRIFRDDSKQYLLEFYREYAPEEFEEIYAQSAILQMYLDEVKESETPSIAASDLLPEIEETVRKLNYQLLPNEIFDDFVDEFNQYTELLLDVMTEVASIDELRDSQKSQVVELIDFYYHQGWKYIALAISEQTATGPSRRELVQGTVTEIQNIQATYNDELSLLRELCEIEGLLSSPEYRKGQLERELKEYYQENAESNQEIAKEWGKASTEANDSL